MSLSVTVLAAAVASLLSDSVWYYIGKRRGLSVLRLLCRISLEPDTCVRQTEAKFAKFGLRTLLFSKFVPGLNTAAAPLSAVVGTPYARFAPFAFTGAALWAASFTCAGYFFSNQISRITHDLQRLGSWALLLFLGAFVAYIGYRYYERLKFLNQVKGDRITPEELKAKLVARRTSDDHRSAASARPVARSAYASRSAAHLPGGPGNAQRRNFARAGDRALLHLTQRSHQRPCGAATQTARHSSRTSAAGWLLRMERVGLSAGNRRHRRGLGLRPERRSAGILIANSKSIRTS